MLVPAQPCLGLANGERIPLGTKQTCVVFEVDDLTAVPPALAARMAVVQLQPEDLGWR